MADRFKMRQARRGILAGLQPFVDCTLGIAGRGQMMREQFGLALDTIGEILLKHRRNTGVQLLPLSAQQRAIGGVLHQRMLEEVGGMRRGAAAKQQSRVAELAQRGLQLSLIALRHRLDHVIGKLSAEHRADLGDLLGRRPEPVQACQQ